MTNTHCRKHREGFDDESLHVDYATIEDVSFIESQNLTHEDCNYDALTENAEYAFNWVLSLEKDKGRLIIVQDAEDDVLHHELSLQTIQQLADMFQRASALLESRKVN